MLSHGAAAAALRIEHGMQCRQPVTGMLLELKRRIDD
jgi:hypothetical protein